MKNMKLFHEGKVVGGITTNHSMSVEDACELLNIDLHAEDGGDPVWDIEKFEMEY